jgi:glycine/D-amino acid oxidase-like deaminating enzyme
MVATAPLPQSFWDEYGFHTMPTFADDRNLIIYGQRTADNRIAFGGRGAPYHFGSTIEDRFDHVEKVFRALESTLRELFPALDAPFTHHWGGPLAMPRRREPSVVVDQTNGLAHAGGYTGDGVTLSRVCGEALADLITRPTEITAATQLPFVQSSFKKWEFEPARWLGINAGLTLATRADEYEQQQGREGWPHSLLRRLLGE